MKLSRTQKRGLLVLRVVVSGTLLAWLLMQPDWSRIGQLVAAAPAYLLLAPPTLLLLIFLSTALRWRLLLRDRQIRLDLRSAYVLYLIGGFYSVILPGALGGDVVRGGGATAATGAPLATIAKSIVVERVCGALALLFVGAAVVPLLSPALRLALGLPLTGGLVLGAVAGIVGAAIFRRLADARTPTLATVVALSAFAHITDGVATLALARVLELDLPLTVILVANPVVFVATVLPISLGGLGVREGVMAFILGFAGVAGPDAVALALLIHANRVVVALLGGALHLTGLGRSAPPQPPPAGVTDNVSR